MLRDFARLPIRTLRLRTSARNMLRGVVTSIVHGEINAEVGCWSTSISCSTR